MQQSGTERKREVTAALEAARDSAARSSQGAVARQMRVGTSVLSRWLAGDSQPEGENRRKLLDWFALERPAPDSAAEVAYLRGALAAIGRMGVKLDELAREFAQSPEVPTPAATGAVPPPPAPRRKAAEG